MRQSRLIKHQEGIKMKSKLIAAVAAVAIIIGFSAMGASAWSLGASILDGGLMLYPPGTTESIGSDAPDAASQKFLDETKEATLAIAADQTELRAIVAEPTLDSKRVCELAENITTNQLLLEE
jgi:hypothetical protein